MVVGLVPPDEQESIAEKLVEYYKNLYPGIEFAREREELSHEQVGELLYTYPGEETEATAKEKMRMISSAIGEGYNTPIIVLKKGDKHILLDGHRRVRVAYSEGLKWPAMVIAPNKEVKFGIEDMVLGKVKELF
ncbi:hypothetical protein GF318_01030 [Candidatus Micrarchaeota archaeon]|nr:hypothetical protein [Candidatus Micrarchaeota archaeon]